MTGEPIPGLSDQRYFHVALLAATRTRDFRMDWVWTALKKDFKVSPGRYKRADLPDGALEFKAVHAGAMFASPGSRGALAISDDSPECAYDVFGGVANGIVIFGTGYAALTKHLVARLVNRDLVEKARFMVPKLPEIVQFCRTTNGQPKSRDIGPSMKFTVTGFSAILPGVKNLRQIRLGGSDVFNSGLVEQIERWLQTRGPEQSQGAETLKDTSHSLQYQAVRVKATGTMSGSSASLSLAGDGGCKVWLRRKACNLNEFVDAVSTLKRLDKFDETTEAPSWSEEAET